jgi:hypothetical protein
MQSLLGLCQQVHRCGHLLQELQSSLYSVDGATGCAVDVNKEIASFTHNGKLVDVVVEGTKDVLFGAAYLSPGTKIETNFGEGMFRF